jgi:membrane-bound PQQ-dependent dehydrogenase (glucose/quinate/shikimate family)
MHRTFICVAVALLTSCGRASTQQAPQGPEGWPVYGHDEGSTRFSPLSDINRENASKLTIAWIVHTGETVAGPSKRRVGFESTPIVLDGTLYFTTGTNRIIALNADTGVKRWEYDPKIDLTADYGDGLINRGVVIWADSATNAGPCRHRVFEATLDGRLVAVDAETGKSCDNFGTHGEVSLTNVAGFRRGIYHMTSPPAVIDDLVIVGSAINDNGGTDDPAGVVRAFDARSGTLRWSWDPIPANTNGTKQPLAAGAANAWSVMATDAQRHLVFVPTGSASPDYFGGLRPGDDKWADSIVALRSQTGEFQWGFQLVHHDLWDYDTASPPLLTTITVDSRQIPVVIQTNKTGFIYVLHRDTGMPVFPVEERPVPKSDVPGEQASATQPIPVSLPATAPQRFAESDVWGATDKDLAACRNTVRGLRSEGVFTPPSIKGTVAVPGNVGGPNWSGTAFDSQRGLLLLNTNNLPALVKLIPREEFERTRQRENGEYGLSVGTPFVLFRRYIQAPSGLPCSRPPWGSLIAVDINRRAIKWQVPLGSLSLLVPAIKDVPPGSITLGGPIMTAGGLVFIAGTMDPFLRAFDVDSGRELWKGSLPASGHATPMTYRTASGRQFVVIAAGGHAKFTEEQVGDSLVAFAFPK